MKTHQKYSLTICYFGTYRKNYARNALLIEGLIQNGVHVIECHQTLWRGVEDRVNAASGGWKSPAFLLRVLKSYTQLLMDFIKLPDYDAMVVGYPGHFDVFLARVFAWLRRKPLAWDVLNSIYLISKERSLDKRSPFTVTVIKTIERLACKLPDMLFLDTERFVQWFCTTHKLTPSKFRIIPIGGDNRFFHPLPAVDITNGRFVVVYYGSYIPNHGVDVILRSAELLKSDTSIEFIMIGDGPEKSSAVELSRQLNLHNVHFHDWLTREALIDIIAKASLVLGAFGTTKQITLTNNNKIYEAFAMRRPVISGNSPALPSVLEHKKNIYLVERGNPHALANAIIDIKSHPELIQNMVDNGEKLFHSHFSIEKIGKIYRGYLLELLSATKRKR